MRDNLALLSDYKPLVKLSRPVLLPGPVAAWSATPDNSTVTLGDGWADVYGPDSLAVLRQGWIYLVHPDYRLGAIQRWLAGRLGELPYESVSLTLVHGVYRPVRSLVFPAAYEGGEVVRWNGYNQIADDDKVINL